MLQNIVLSCSKSTADNIKSHLEKDNFNISYFSSGIELIAYLVDDDNPKDLLVLCGSTSHLTIEEIYFSLLQSKKSIYYPILFITESNALISHLKESGISEKNIFSSCGESVKTAEFIRDRASYYESLLETLRTQDYFSGDLRNINFSDLLFNIEKFKKTGVLNISSEKYMHFDLFFKDGKLVCVDGDNGIMPTKDLEAIKEVFNLKDSGNLTYQFMGDVAAPEITIEEPTSKTISKIFKLFESNRSISIKDTSVILSRTTNGSGTRNIEPASKKEEKKIMLINTGSDLEKAVEIAENTYWVSQRNPKTLLQTNTFLRVFKGETRTINMMIDPGASEYFSVISRKTSSVINDISKIHMYSVNHQDPDVGMNSTFISKINPKSACLCTEDTWRLVQFYEIPKTSYKNVYSFDNKKVSLSTSANHTLEIIPTPYCHFVGAFALYDTQNRVLFTGDLFGGLNPANDLGLVANESHWEGIKTFHQIYMPSKRAIQRVIDSIRSMPVPPLMIVPQHGAILTGHIMDQFLNRLYNLDVGIDLFEKEPEDKTIPLYIQIMSELYERMVSYIGNEQAARLFNFQDKNQPLFHFIEMDQSGIRQIYSAPETALNLMLKVISQYPDITVVNEIKSLAIKETLTRRLPMPINIYSDDTSDDDAALSPFKEDMLQEESIFS